MHAGQKDAEISGNITGNISVKNLTVEDVTAGNITLTTGEYPRVIGTVRVSVFILIEATSISGTLYIQVDGVTKASFGISGSTQVSTTKTADIAVTSYDSRVSSYYSGSGAVKNKTQTISIAQDLGVYKYLI